MGSKFIEKHKRKSLLAALLLIFQGRAKYIGIMLIVTVLSVPFVVSSETLSRLVEFRPVAAFLNTVGLGSVVSAINPKYSNDMLKAALDRAAADSESNSFWQKFLNRISATMPAGGSGTSSLTMIVGGNEDIFGPPEIKDGKNNPKAGPGDVKGVVNEDERNNGQGVDGVDLRGLLAEAVPGVADDSGLYGDLMGQNMAGNYAGGSASASGPYANRVMLGKRGGAAAGGSDAMYSKVMGQSASRVPVPNSPSKVNTKRMGRVSGFSWKNMGYRNKSAMISTKLGSKKPMFQLAETFAMTAAGSKNENSAYEYQAAYVGSTYDGNDASADVIETGFDTSPTVPPDTSFIDGMISGASDIQEAAKECTEAQGTHGAAMSEDGKKMDDISKTLGSPPKCCSSRVGSWNSKIEQIKAACLDYNVHEAAQASACQITSSPMDCNSYNKMKIKKCSKWKCWLSIILMILLLPLLFSIAVVVGVVSAISGGGFFEGAMGFFNDFMKFVQGDDNGDATADPIQGKASDFTTED